MSPSKLIPKIDLEYSLLNYAYEKFQASGKLLDIFELLYFPETKALFERIKQGENVQMDFTLHTAFLDAYTSENQANAIQTTLEDLKGRRDTLKLATEDVYNFDIDYSLKSEICSIDDLIAASVNQIINNPRGMHPNKWDDFYSTIGGFLPGEWIGIAGGSGDGKTTWAIDLLHSFQEKYECKNAFISCEMSKNALGKKIVKRSLKITTEEYILLANKHGEEKIREKGFANWKNCQFLFDIYTLQDVQNYIRKEKPRFWALDYVGMLKRDHRFSAGDWAVELSNCMKALCKETGTIGIGLYQLDKTSQVNGKDGKRRIPTLADIYGGIGNKQAMDSGAVVYRRGQDHFVYWDKIRDEYNPRYKGTHFKAIGNSGTGEIHTLEPQDQFNTTNRKAEF